MGDSRRQILPGTGRGTSRRLVEGSARPTLIDQELNNCFSIGKHLLRRNSDHPIPFSHEPPIACFVASRISTSFVNLAINFDEELGFQTCKIDDELACGLLASELVPARPGSKNLP